ncbi:hypothetical protein Ciccas_007663 [Cichlidogyrus casuarinus]|uniref:SH3 domain-containing protein n=1 Tax=Cichlidogyrus casuarinus TaxID=1844966 RepID=A0ABD2Q2G2_9PLAT
MQNFARSWDQYIEFESTFNRSMEINNSSMRELLLCLMEKSDQLEKQSHDFSAHSPMSNASYQSRMSQDQHLRNRYSQPLNGELSVVSNSQRQSDSPNNLDIDHPPTIAKKPAIPHSRTDNFVDLNSKIKLCPYDYLQKNKSTNKESSTYEPLRPTRTEEHTYNTISSDDDDRLANKSQLNHEKRAENSGSVYAKVIKPHVGIRQVQSPMRNGTKSYQNAKNGPRDSEYINMVPEASNGLKPPFMSQFKDELSFQRDEVLRVLPWPNDEDHEDGWFFGERIQTRERGLFPENYTRIRS